MSHYRVDQLFHFEKGSLQSSKCQAGEFDFITASAEWKKHNEFTHDCEALVFAAAAAGSLGRTHYVNGKFIPSDLCFVLTPKDANLFPVDLQFYHLIFRELRADIVKNTKAGTSKEAISLGSFGKYELPYFDIKKQIEIKAKFVKAEEEKEKLASELNHQLSLVKELRQALLREAIQGQLVAQDERDEPASVLLAKIKAEKEKLLATKKIKREKPLPPIKPEEIPFAIPDNWVWCRLGEICTKVTDGFHHTPKKVENGKIYISATHIKESGISWDECSFIPEKEHNELYKKAYPQKGEILITNRGAGCGTPALIDIEDAFSFQNAALIGFNQSFVNNKYIHNFILKSRAEIMGNFVNGGLQPMLSNVVLRSIPFPLPPLAEQKRIVAKLEILIQHCDELEANIRQGSTHTETLLQVALKEALAD